MNEHNGRPQPPGRGDLIAAATLAGLHQVGVALTAPLLAKAPLLLVLLSPLARHLLLVAPNAELWPFVAIAAGRRTLGSAVGHGVGRAYGQRSMVHLRQRAPVTARWVARFERWFRRADNTLAFLVPSGTALLAGATQMPRWRYLSLASAGHVFWACTTYLLGDLFRPYLMPIIAFLTEYMAPVTAFLILFVVGQVLYRRHGRRARSHRGPE